MEKLRQRPPVARVSSRQRSPSSAATTWRSSANATVHKSNAFSLSQANSSSLPGSISKPWKSQGKRILHGTVMGCESSEEVD
ncbi:hypothetical protein L6452_40653 [Arctium lappa]|uniref:Uncharacterized protein n=1 Tax=Arctium lappa TaxID=4217 RepID=A0ACB8XMV5_ARCLA|nr:hypothetical protein L6452_40653 [Arctium lappa]